MRILAVGFLGFCGSLLVGLAITDLYQLAAALFAVGLLIGPIGRSRGGAVSMAAGTFVAGAVLYAIDYVNWTRTFWNAGPENASVGEGAGLLPLVVAVLAALVAAQALGYAIGSWVSRSRSSVSARDASKSPHGR